MMEELATGCRVLQDRRDLDTALGVLVALRRHRRQEAFDELSRAAHRHRISLFSVASALVKLASGDDVLREDSAVQVAHREWSDLFGHQRPTATALNGGQGELSRVMPGGHTVTAIPEHGDRTEPVHPH